MKNNALYPAMKDAMGKIIEAEETAVAWRKEIARCKSDLNLIIRTAKKLDPALAEVDTLDIIKALRAEFTPAEPETEPTEETPAEPAE